MRRQASAQPRWSRAVMFLEQTSSQNQETARKESICYVQRHVVVHARLRTARRDTNTQLREVYHWLRNPAIQVRKFARLNVPPSPPIGGSG